MMTVPNRMKSAEKINDRMGIISRLEGRHISITLITEKCMIKLSTTSSMLFLYQKVLQSSCSLHLVRLQVLSLLWLKQSGLDPQHSFQVWWGRDARVCFKTIMASPKEVSAEAAIASVITNLEYLHQEKNKEQHWRLFSIVKTFKVCSRTGYGLSVRDGDRQLVHKHLFWQCPTFSEHF